MQRESKQEKIENEDCEIRHVVPKVISCPKQITGHIHISKNIAHFDSFNWLILRSRDVLFPMVNRK